MAMNLDPKKVAAVQNISSQIVGTITTDYKDGTIYIEFTAATPEADAFMKEKLLAQLPALLAQQLGVMFRIKGELIDVNRPGAST